MDESEEGNQNPLNHENWIKQTIWKFIKYVVHHRHPMTPEQLKQKLTENVPKTLSKAPCLVAKRMSPTLHLLLFAQSM